MDKNTKLYEIINSLSGLTREELRTLNNEVVGHLKDFRQEVKAKFRNGQMVQFFDKRYGVTIRGKITKLMPVNCRVLTTTGMPYRVSPELLKEWDGMIDGVKWNGCAPDTSKFKF